ncbi:MAG: hypothetical protein ACOX2O_08725 [Bdellovibrionota bacterium]|jgi:hypothetical protein
MSDAYSDLPVRDFLVEAKRLDPNDTRLEIYDAIQAAVSKMVPWIHLTITTSTGSADEVLMESLCRRFAHQLQRTVLGMRKKSKIPILTVLEKNPNGAWHAHFLIGKIEGSQRLRNATTFKHYIQKQPLSAVVKILNRLTYYDSSRKKPGRIGKSYINPVYFKEGLVDYLLKKSKLNLLNVAWMACNIRFQVYEVSVYPICEKLP